MILEITKSNFKILNSEIQPALKEILDNYPDIKQNLMFKSRSEQSFAEQLQIALYLLGLHIRVHPEGYVFTLKTLMPEPLIQNNCLQTLTILSHYTIPNCTMKIVINEMEKEICFDNLKEEKNPDQTLILAMEAIPEIDKGPGRPKRIKK
jgi:hypothetical protein